MKRFFRWLPLVLIGYFTAEIVVLRLSGRVPTQVSAGLVWTLVLASVAWLAFQLRRELSGVHFDQEREQGDGRDNERENESEQHSLPPTTSP